MCNSWNFLNCVVSWLMLNLLCSENKELPQLLKNVSIKTGKNHPNQYNFMAQNPKPQIESLWLSVRQFSVRVPRTKEVSSGFCFSKMLVPVIFEKYAVYLLFFIDAQLCRENCMDCPLSRRQFHILPSHCIMLN